MDKAEITERVLRAAEPIRKRNYIPSGPFVERLKEEFGAELADQETRTAVLDYANNAFTILTVSSEDYVSPSDTAAPVLSRAIEMCQRENADLERFYQEGTFGDTNLHTRISSMAFFGLRSAKNELSMIQNARIILTELACIVHNRNYPESPAENTSNDLLILTIETFLKEPYVPSCQVDTVVSAYQDTGVPYALAYRTVQNTLKKAGWQELLLNADWYLPAGSSEEDVDAVLEARLFSEDELLGQTLKDYKSGEATLVIESGAALIYFALDQVQTLEEAANKFHEKLAASVRREAEPRDATIVTPTDKSSRIKELNQKMQEAREKKESAQTRALAEADEETEQNADQPSSENRKTAKKAKTRKAPKEKHEGGGIREKARAVKEKIHSWLVRYRNWKSTLPGWLQHMDLLRLGFWIFKLGLAIWLACKVWGRPSFLEYLMMTGYIFGLGRFLRSHFLDDEFNNDGKFSLEEEIWIRENTSYGQGLSIAFFVKLMLVLVFGWILGLYDLVVSLIAVFIQR